MQSRQADREFRSVDADHDGKVSLEEWIAKYGSADGFDHYDKDGNGIIDPCEFRAAKGMAVEFNAVDTNHDGKISIEEWIARYGTADGFADYDVDGDGMVDADEFRGAKLRNEALSGQFFQVQSKYFTPQVRCQSGGRLFRTTPVSTLSTLFRS